MKPYLFTIVIPSYNRAHFISHAIQSVIDQTFQNWELIIIDDGSTDNTKDVVLSFDDIRIKYVYQKNQERSIARNNGIKRAKGIWICFLDSDDYFLENHLTVLKEYIILKGSPIAMLYVKPKLKTNRDFNTYENILKSIIHTQHACIHSIILQKHLFSPKLNIAEDIDLWMRIADEYPILNIDKNTVVIQDHDDRTVNYLHTNSFQKGLLVFKSLYKDKRWENKISSYVKRTTMSDCYFGIAKYHMHQENIFKAMVNLIHSIIIYPNRQFKHKIYLLLSLNKFFSAIFKFKNGYKKTCN